MFPRNRLWFIVCPGHDDIKKYQGKEEKALDATSYRDQSLFSCLTILHQGSFTNTGSTLVSHCPKTKIHPARPELYRHLQRGHGKSGQR
jgi:hypothetical protein